MPRPPKLRRVEFIPQVTVFKPAGVSLRDLEEEVLTVEELEAIRLKDLERLEQEECAERMQVSRPTFQRVLSSAREKVARALVEGKAIRFEGGTYRLALGQFRCGACSYEFEAPFSAARSGADPACPHCGAKRGKIAGRVGHDVRWARSWARLERDPEATLDSPGYGPDTTWDDLNVDPTWPWE